MEFATEKWGGIPHYRGSVARLGDDEFGSWWWGEKGRTIFRGDTPLFVAEQPVLFLTPPDRWLDLVAHHVATFDEATVRKWVAAVS